MTLEIGFLFGLLAVMVALFLTEKLPVDLTAFLGLVVLVFTGYVTAEDAFHGFSSPAVITMLSIFIVSAALLQTGIAEMLGSRIHRWVGGREIPLMVTVMLTAGILSAFMNNIAATAVLMPAVAALGRQAGLSPARLFMPLAFGAILGGTTTLVGTPPNILAGAMLKERGLEPFALFDFTPLGAALLVLGVLFMTTLGRRLLPVREVGVTTVDGIDLAQLYELQDRLFSLRIPKGSRLDGATVGDARLGTDLGLQVVAVIRNGHRELAPTVETHLLAEDELLVQGRLEDLKELLRVRKVQLQDPVTSELRPPPGISGLRARWQPDSPCLGKSLRELDFRERFGVLVVGIERDGQMLRERLASELMRPGDEFLALGTHEKIDQLATLSDLEVLETGVAALDRLQEQPLFVISIPESSPLEGCSIAVSRMGELTGLTIVGLVRGGTTHMAIDAEEVLQAGDRLLVAGERARITGLIALGDVQLESHISTGLLESPEVGVIEATVAPRSSLDGETLRGLAFRERYGVQVLGVWREGKPIHRELAELQLRVGDGLLLHGPREKLKLLSSDRDFVVLRHDEEEVPRRTNRAGFALGALALMIVLVVSGLQPIQVAAFTAATLVVLSGAVTMREAYRAIEWRAIFLVAAVLPVGGAMESSGAALLLAEQVTGLAGPLGPYVVLGSLIFLSSLLSQGLDGAPAVVLLTPVVLSAAEGLDIAPYPLMMGVSLAASAAFMTPFSHKANLLVMGLGGYKSIDYVRVGTPLTVVVLVALTFLVPVFFPF